MAQSLKHLAIIMDGNGRWARKKNKPRYYGHVRGARVVREIVSEIVDLGIPYLTLFAFSTENWVRPKDEVDLLMRLLGKYLKDETENLIEKNICLSVIGDASKLPESVQKQLKLSVEKTKNCKGLNLCFALNYGSRQELTSVIQKLLVKVKKGEIQDSEINEDLIRSHLFTASFPDPDLILRTSGEFRISNFLLWQAAYSEFYFSSVLWPDFKTEDLRQVIENFEKRERRFGAAQQL